MTGPRSRIERCTDTRETVPCWRSCDVLVVGAGPAGASAARAAAEAGARVVVVERRPVVGRPARCAGFVPAPLIARLDVNPRVIAQGIRRVLTHHPGGIEESPCVGYIVHRERFDRKLARDAVAAGACLLTSSRVSGVNEDGTVTVRREGRSLRIRAKVVVGADGPSSSIGRGLGSANHDFAVGAQVTAALRKPADDIRVYFRPELPGGYGWVFPRNGSAAVGVAIGRGTGVLPAAALRDFLVSLAPSRLLDRVTGPMTGGLIPVGGPLRCRMGNVLLCGDAAGHCHPLTGAGIVMALQSGEMAGEAAAASALRADEDPLARYEDEVEEVLSETLRRAARQREELYGKDGCFPGKDVFSAVLRKVWFGFPDSCRTI